MTTALQQFLQGIKSGLQVIIDQLEASFFSLVETDVNMYIAMQRICCSFKSKFL